MGKENSLLTRVKLGLEKLFQSPPIYEELIANFPHSEGCSGMLPLTQAVRAQVLFTSTPFAGPDIASFYVLRCDECHEERRFVKR